MKTRVLIAIAMSVLSTALAISGFGGTSADAGTVRDATFVYGQAGSFTSRNSGALNASTIQHPGGSAIDKSNHRLFVVDRYRNRVLVYNLGADNKPTDDTADYVIGQVNFTAVGLGTTATTLYSPEGLIFDETKNRLWVSDLDNNRVLGYELSGIGNGMSASHVFGQPNFTTNAQATTQNGLRTPRGLAFDPKRQRLYVVDSGNNRVVVHDTTSPAPGQNAFSVLGQSSYTGAGSGTTQATLAGALGAAYEVSTAKLFIADNGNNRVVAYDTDGLAIGMNASLVIGQSSFTTANPNVNQAGLDHPRGLAVDGGMLFIADFGNMRVLGHKTAGLVNGANASIVIGQQDFVSKAPAVGASSLDQPMFLSFDATTQKLFVSDYNNYRVLVFDAMTQIGDVVVQATVNPSLTFVVSGRSTVCNAQASAGFQTGSSATAVNLGRLTAGSTAGGAQDIQVDTNAANGFAVFVRTPGVTPNALNDGLGRSIADASGTRAAPASAPTAGIPGFGYTSSDTLTAFTPNTFAKVSNVNDSVLLANAGTISKTSCVGYQAAVNAATTASNYSVTIIYSVVPSF